MAEIYQNRDSEPQKLQKKALFWGCEWPKLISRKNSKVGIGNNQCGIFEDFSATQILREIDFGHLLGSKYAENGYILHLQNGQNWLHTKSEWQKNSWISTQ